MSSASATSWSTAKGLVVEKEHSFTSNSPDYASLLRACGNSKSLPEARKLHAQILSNEQREVTTFIENLIVEMYGKCGSIDEACLAFEKIKNRNVFSWVLMISAFAHNGHCRLSLAYFWRMNLEGVKSDLVGYVTILNSVFPVASEREASLIHACVVESGMISDIVVGNAMLNLYSNCCSLEKTREFFDQMPSKDVITWSSLISAYARRGHIEAFVLLRKMDQEGIHPNQVTFVNLCSACYSKSFDHKVVELLGNRIIECGYLSMTGSVLIEMYGKVGQIQNARWVFQRMHTCNVVAWTAMITAYEENGEFKEAFELFRTMELEGIEPDKVAILSLLNACARSGCLGEGKLAHIRVYELGLDLDIHNNLGNSLINMYGKCGAVEHAECVFMEMNTKNVITWTAFITANAHSGHLLEAFILFHRMDLEGFQPSLVTLVTMVDACASLGDATRSKLIHECVEDLAYAPQGILGNALVNMYGKCGNVEKAMNVFKGMKERDSFAWNSMVAAYAQAGDIDLSLWIIQEMELEGIRATGITFINIFTALGHAGMMRRCWECLVSMVVDYGVKPDGNHYRCMVDMLARLGHIQLAKELMELMPFEPNAPAWMSLLSAFNVHGSSCEAHAAKAAAGHVFKLEPGNASPYLTLASIYAY